MPSPTNYSYVIRDYFPGSQVDSGRLMLEVQASPIATALLRVDTGDGVCDIWFKDVLSVSDESTLDAVVSAHSGAPLPQQVQVVRLNGPVEPDDKPIVVVSPATYGMRTWLTGRGDSPAGAGQGPQLRIDCDGPGEDSMEFSFIEPTEVNDGQLWWRPASAWGPDDEFDFGVRMPATAATATPGSGNANAVPVAAGVDMYVPAAGDGSHTIDLVAAVPVRAAERNGYWDVDNVTGKVTPSVTPGQAGWNLLSATLNALIVRGISMGHPLGVWDIDVYETEYVHQNWRLVLTVRKATQGAGTIGGWMLAFRHNVLLESQ